MLVSLEVGPCGDEANDSMNADIVFCRLRACLPPLYHVKVGSRLLVDFPSINVDVPKHEFSSLWPKALNMKLRGFDVEAQIEDKHKDPDGAADAKATETAESDIEEGEIEDGEIGNSYIIASKKRTLDDRDGQEVPSDKNTEKLNRMLSKFAKQKNNLMKMQKKWREKHTSTGADDYLRDYDDVNYSYCVRKKD